MKNILVLCGFVMLAVIIFAVFVKRTPDAVPMMLEEAQPIAQAAIMADANTRGFILIDQKTQKKPFGYVFFYRNPVVPVGSRADEGAPRPLPVVVDNKDKQAHFLSVIINEESAILEYARKRNFSKE